MSMAWRARDPLERIAYARKALKANEKFCNVTLVNVQCGVVLFII